jgi:hypothetical protein
MTPTGKIEEGWGWPGNSVKAHFFVGSRSLCGKWLFMGELTADTGGETHDDCKACAKKMVARRGQGTK